MGGSTASGPKPGEHAPRREAQRGAENPAGPSASPARRGGARFGRDGEPVARADVVRRARRERGARASPAGSGAEPRRPPRRASEYVPNRPMPRLVARDLDRSGVEARTGRAAIRMPRVRNLHQCARNGQKLEHDDLTRAASARSSTHRRSSGSVTVSARARRRLRRGLHAREARAANASIHRRSFGARTCVLASRFRGCARAHEATTREEERLVGVQPERRRERELTREEDPPPALTCARRTSARARVQRHRASPGVKIFDDDRRRSRRERRRDHRARDGHRLSRRPRYDVSSRVHRDRIASER